MIDEPVDRGAHQAAQHAELGLDRMFLADSFFAAARFAAPGQGVAPDDARTARIAERFERVARAMVTEGVVPCIRQHVGTWIETPDELEQILVRVSADVLLFGPDTGHLAWAGADPRDVIARHRDRVGAVNVKDVRLDVAAQARAESKDYWQTTAEAMWAEPGRGDLDLDGVLDVLGDFDGRFIVEVDLADQPTVAESAKVAADWMRPRLERGRSE